MKILRYLLLALFSFLVLILVGMLEEEEGKLLFSNNAHYIDSDVNYTFVLTDDSMMRFKYSTKNLKDSRIIFTNDKTSEVIFSINDETGSDTLIQEIPAGKYRYKIEYGSGKIAYKLVANSLTKKSD